MTFLRWLRKLWLGDEPKSEMERVAAGYIRASSMRENFRQVFGQKPMRYPLVCAQCNAVRDLSMAECPSCLSTAGFVFGKIFPSGPGSSARIISRRGAA